jgi:SLT domain-containing protein
VAVSPCAQRVGHDRQQGLRVERRGHVRVGEYSHRRRIGPGWSTGHRRVPRWSSESASAGSRTSRARTPRRGTLSRRRSPPRRALRRPDSGSRRRPRAIDRVGRS